MPFNTFIRAVAALSACSPLYRNPLASTATHFNVPVTSLDCDTDWPGNPKFSCDLKLLMVKIYEKKYPPYRRYCRSGISRPFFQLRGRLPKPSDQTPV